MKGEAKLFPIQSDGYVRGKGEIPATKIPWWLAEVAHEHYHYAQHNTQSLEELAKRGGFGRDELVKLIRRE